MPITTRDDVIAEATRALETYFSSDFSMADFHLPTEPEQRQQVICYYAFLMVKSSRGELLSRNENQHMGIISTLVGELRYTNAPELSSIIMTSKRYAKMLDPLYAASTAAGCCACWGSLFGRRTAKPAAIRLGKDVTNPLAEASVKPPSYGATS